MKHIDEQRLDSDLLYRFQYLQLVQKHKEFLIKHIRDAVKRISEISLKYSVTRKIHLSRVDGYEYKECTISNDIDDINMESENVIARIERFSIGVVYNVCGPWDDQHVTIMAKNFSAKGWGNANVDIDEIHNVAFNNLLLNKLVSEIFDSEITREEQKGLVMALTKMFSIWSDFKDYVRTHQQ